MRAKDVFHEVILSYCSNAEINMNGFYLNTSIVPVKNGWVSLHIRRHCCLGSEYLCTLVMSKVSLGCIMLHTRLCSHTQYTPVNSRYIFYQIQLPYGIHFYFYYFSMQIMSMPMIRVFQKLGILPS